MPKLVLQFDDRVLKECVVSATVTIGRLPDNTLAIDNPAVSARHARVVRDGDQFVVEDLESTNGTFVNGEKLDGERALFEGDAIRFGAAGPQITFHTVDTSTVAAPPVVVVTRYRSSASRIATPSSRTIPSRPSIRP